jgi:Flp pilus assembly pilin Flp
MKVMNLLRNQSGQDLVEYSLLVAMIACFCIVSIHSVGLEIAHGFDLLSGDLATSL